MDIVFPEYQNPIISRAISKYSLKHPNSKINPIKADDLESGCKILKELPKAALITGIDYTTREVALACKHHIGIIDKSGIFSSCFVMYNENPANKMLKTIIVADAGINKNPTVEQLVNIVIQTHHTASQILSDTPRIAMLSFSTRGSAKDSSIDKIQNVISEVRRIDPKIQIDGEMQLDCAVNQSIAAKKISGSSPVAGHANVLIAPDLNSGNILYKSLEQFGGYTAAGPILQGFDRPISDLSRGSTIDDVVLVIETLVKMAK